MPAPHPPLLVPPYKKTCPCTILPPHFFDFSDSTPSGGHNQNLLLPPPFIKGGGEGGGVLNYSYWYNLRLLHYYLNYFLVRKLYPYCKLLFGVIRAVQKTKMNTLKSWSERLNIQMEMYNFLLLYIFFIKMNTHFYKQNCNDD